MLVRVDWVKCEVVVDVVASHISWRSTLDALKKCFLLSLSSAKSAQWISDTDTADRFFTSGKKLLKQHVNPRMDSVIDAASTPIPKVSRMRLATYTFKHAFLKMH